MTASPHDEEVLRIFRESGALLEGHFILRSGLRSGHFFQCAQVCQYLDKVTRLATLLIEQLPVPLLEAVETVLAPAMGGLVIGQEVARQAGKRFIFVEKVNDVLEMRRNFRLGNGESVLVVEDVITRGGRVREALDIVSAQEAEARAVAVLVDRSNGETNFGKVPLYPLMRMNFPTYSPEALPPELAALPATKPGS